MARISPTNPRHRTRQQIGDDIAFVLNAPITYGTRYAVLKEATWVWTEYHGKFKGCHYWSQEAARQFAVNKKRSLLRHEHVVPKKIVIEMLMELHSPAPKVVRSILDKFLVGVVVTKMEDDKLNSRFAKSMPPEFDDVNSDNYHNPWLRYKACGISVLFMPLQIDAILKFIPFLRGKTSFSPRFIRRLERAFYRHGWVDDVFDWPNWAEAESYVMDRSKLSNADAPTIRRLLTTHVRKEHFCEGHLLEMLASGHLLDALERLAVLRKIPIDS